MKQSKVMTSSNCLGWGCARAGRGLCVRDDARNGSGKEPARATRTRNYICRHQKPCYGPDADRPAKGFDSVSAPSSVISRRPRRRRRGTKR